MLHTRVVARESDGVSSNIWQEIAMRMHLCVFMNLAIDLHHQELDI